MFSVYVRKEKYRLINRWCLSAMGTEGFVWRYGYEGTGGPLIYSFNTEKDLMWFSLAWGDQIVKQCPVG